MRLRDRQKLLLRLVLACLAGFLIAINLRHVRSSASRLASDDDDAYTAPALHGTDFSASKLMPSIVDAQEELQHVSTATTSQVSKIASSKPASKIAKVSMLYGTPNPVSERAITLHQEHADRWGNPMLVCRQPMLDGIWTKIACLLGFVLGEMGKADKERAEWVFWMDADTVVMNPNIPLDIFLPPQERFASINLLISNDFNGLNAGVFLLKINSWTVEFLSAIISYRYYKYGKLFFAEQTAIDELLRDDKWRYNALRVPQQWFNAYLPDGDAETGSWASHQARRGDFQIHFAGVADRERKMEAWIERAERREPEWVVSLEETTLVSEIGAFWKKQEQTLAVEPSEVERGLQELKRLVTWAEKYTNVFGDELNSKIRDDIEDAVDNGKDVLRRVVTHLDVVEIALEVLRESTIPLHSLLKDTEQRTIYRSHAVIYDTERIVVRCRMDDLLSYNVELPALVSEAEQQVVALRDLMRRDPDDFAALERSTNALEEVMRSIEQAYDIAVATKKDGHVQVTDTT